MGVVYAAHDGRLKRIVALKMISSAGDDRARTRFWREAQVAASVNHPNVCQIYEIGEDHGELFIAMELLEGESLSERLRRGPLNVSQALPIGLGILAALTALHARGIVHRDLKPSNVFLTPHGVKLLDFGLARPQPEPALNSEMSITNTGMVMGTPSYMAPEQVTATEVDGRCDLYAVGAILFEMLAGRQAFGGRNMVDILHATMYEQPPALQGTPAVAAVDRVIRRALAKRPADRPASADAMADELRAIHGGDDNTATLARPLTRLVVLPFRQLRPDPETDFLAFSLADAIATSLSGVGSLIVRSSTTAARFAADTPDLKALAAEADVDRVVIGTLLRSGDQLRAVAQLVEAPGGTLLTSQTVQSSLGDLFRLQDDLARRIVEALSLPLTGEAAMTTPDAPHNARAYEFYLRGNELARTMDGMVPARDFYQRCLELDPRFAPAWARLGRCQRLIGKFVESAPDSRQRAQECVRSCPRAQPAIDSRAQVLREPGSGDRPGVARDRATAERGAASRQRSRTVRGTRACVSLLRTLRRVTRRPRRSPPARSECAHQFRAYLAAEWGRRAAPGRGAAAARREPRRVVHRPRPRSRRGGASRRVARSADGNAQIAARQRVSVL